MPPNQPLPSEDNRTWISILSFGAVVAVVILGYILFHTFSRQKERAVEEQQPTPAKVESVSVPESPTWNPPPSPPPNIPHKVSAPNNNTDILISNEERNRQMAHQQAEALRQMIRENRLPKSYGNLTLERVDEMEKNHISIW